MYKKSIHTSALLQAHQYQGQSYDCGPYSAAIVTNALSGSEMLGADVAQWLNQPIRWGILPIAQRIRNRATLPWAITRFLHTHHLGARWRVLTSTRQLLNGLERNAVFVVLIGEWRPLWAHYLVLVEYDPEDGYGFVDPAQAQAAIVYRDEKTFLRQWSNWGRQMIEVTKTSS